MKINYDPQDFADLAQLANLVPGRMMHTARVLETIGDDLMKRWRSWALGAAMPDGGRMRTRSGAYARSIKMRSANKGQRIAVEVYSDSPLHDSLSEGTRERDLKAILGRSAKARVSADGKRYLVIPFRHDVTKTKGEERTGMSVRGEHRVTRDIQRWFKKQEQATGAATTVRHPARPGGRAKYTWGPRLRLNTLEGRMRARHGPAGKDPVTGQTFFPGQASKMSSFGRATHKTGRFEGMVHTKVHGSYLTFRTMSENSPPGSWIHPGTKGRHFIRHLYDYAMSQDVVGKVGEAVRLDAKALIGGHG